MSSILEEPQKLVMGKAIRREIGNVQMTSVHHSIPNTQMEMTPSELRRSQCFAQDSQFMYCMYIYTQT